MSPGPAAASVSVPAARSPGLWCWWVAGPLKDLFPASDGFVGLEDEELKRFLPVVLDEAPLLLKLGVTLSAFVYHLLPLLIIGVPLPSFWLPAATRDRYAQKIAKSRFYFVRQPIFLLKLIGGLAWGRLADVREQLNLPSYPESDPGSWRTS